MATVKQCLEYMRSFAPEEYTYEYDNTGFIVGDEDASVSKILCCLDVTERVIDEAIRLGTELIISHHPMIFAGIKHITYNESLGRKIIKAIRHGINIYSAHTNLDFVSDGVNDYAAELLEVSNCSPLEPYIDEKQGFGRVGELDKVVLCSELCRKAERVFEDPYVRLIGEDKKIKRIAVINGAGGGDVKYIDMAIKHNADCLVTADVKHHVAVYALDNHLTIIEPQHYTMEYCYISRLKDKLTEGLSHVDAGLKVFRSTDEISPRKPIRRDCDERS